MSSIKNSSKSEPLGNVILGPLNPVMTFEQKEKLRKEKRDADQLKYWQALWDKVHGPNAAPSVERPRIESKKREKTGILRTIEGNKKALLTESGFKSAKDAEKRMGLTSAKEVYETLLDIHNEQVKEIRKAAKPAPKAKKVRQPPKKTKREIQAEKISQEIAEMEARRKWANKVKKEQVIKRREEKKEALLSKSGVHFISSFTADKIKFYQKDVFHYGNVFTVEDYYAAVKDAMTRLPSATSLGVFYRNNEGGKNAYRCISANDLYDFESFSAAVEKLLAGESLTGSDVVSQEEFKLVFSHFALARANLAGGFAKGKEIFFKTHKIEESGKGKKDCGLQCLRHIGVLPKDYKDGAIDTMGKMLEFIMKNKLSIGVITNSFYLVKPVHVLLQEEKHREVVEKKNYLLHTLLNEEIKPELVGGHSVFPPLEYEKFESFEHIIVYDIEGQHFDVLEVRAARVLERVSLVHDQRVSLPLHELDQYRLVTSPDLIIHDRHTLVSLHQLVEQGMPTLRGFLGQRDNIPVRGEGHRLARPLVANVGR